MLDKLLPAAAALTGADITLTGGFILLALTVLLLLPDKWKLLYPRSAFKRMERDRDLWRGQADKV